ncbi:MAG: hypothetical protein KJ714_07645 [Euryarchaeota archaeon]|nr:hypothetical protein [Euryarchaeota archaeon]
MKSKIDSIYIKHNGDRIYQGDILRDFKYQDRVFIEDNKIKIQERNIPYLIVLTQDCDLEWDFNNHKENEEVQDKIKDKINQDKFLQSILICPAYPAEKVRLGTHLEELDLNMEKLNSDRWNLVKTNQNSRYYFLDNESDLQIPDLVIDFKHYYSIPRDMLYKEIKKYYIGSINELFRECLSQRFAFYLSRIGLPKIKAEVCEK